MSDNREYWEAMCVKKLQTFGLARNHPWFSSKVSVNWDNDFLVYNDISGDASFTCLESLQKIQKLEEFPNSRMSFFRLGD